MDNPLSDPRATDLLAAKPDQIDAMRRQYDKAAGTAQYIARGLRAADRSPQWIGNAADQFHAAIGHFPHQLDLVTNSYWEVADALQVYGPLVAEYQHDFKTALGPDFAIVYNQLQTALQAQTKDGQEIGRLSAPGSTASEAQIRRARDRYDHDTRVVTTLENQCSPNSRQAYQVLDEFDDARTRTMQKIGLAATIAIRPVNNRVLLPLSSTGAPAGPAPAGTGAVTLTSTAMPASANERVQAMTAYATQVTGTPYVSGGGHAAFTAAPNGGLDCSGFVSGVLHSAGYLNAPQTTETMYSQPGIVDGPGRYVTIYDRTDCGDNEHVIIDINGHFYEEGGGTGDGGAGDVHAFSPSADYLHSFNRILHPVGL